MATALAFSFPWGRYHANPWGHHVNEARVEWPPSPWRLLRALYATWQARLPGLRAEEVLVVLDALAEPPTYWLPPSRRAHSRHYLPLPDAKETRSKAFDTFEVLEKGADLVVRWPAGLDAGQSAVLASLASALPYLGRAESICVARVLDDGVEPTGRVCEPLDAGRRPMEPATGGAREVLSLLVPLRPLDARSLAVRTLDLQAKRLADPPGARWVAYSPAQADEEALAAPRPGRRWRDGAGRLPSRAPTAVRWAIATPARPSIKAAVAMADVLRTACMSRYGRSQGGGASAILAGKDAAGRPLQGHQHAHYLAWDTDGDGLLDVLVLWAPAGLDADDVDALGGLRALSGFGHVSDFRPCRLGLEALGDVRHVVGGSDRDTGDPGLTGPAARWSSHTPFSPPRHAKRGQSWPALVEQEVRRELVVRGKPDPIRTGISPARADWLDFRRHRVTERLPAARRATGIWVEFPEPVEGPLAIGALSHFGLGLLVPDDQH